MQEYFKRSLEIDVARWEDAATSRREWVRRGWVSEERMKAEIEWYEGRAANSRFLLALC
jgi:hypothetical protein